MSLMKKNCFVFYFQRQNKYSINALTGAIETKKYHNKLDIILCNKDLPKLITSIKNKYKTIAIGTSFFSSQIFSIGSTIKTIKNIVPKAILIAGGPHASGDPRGTIGLGFDIVCRGEGEEVILELIEWILGNRSLSKTRGIFFKQKDKIIFTGKRPPVDLDKYMPFSVSFKRFGPIEITRGCPFGCFYCETSYMFGKIPRHRSIESILSCVEIMYSRGIKDIRFITPNAFSYGSKDGKTLNYEKVEKLLKGIRKIIKNKGRIFFGSFPSEVRPEHVNKYTIELVKRFADNDNLVIGCQSGSPRILKICKRAHTVLDVYNAVDLCIKNRLTPKVDFIFGLPGEGEENIIKSIEFMDKLTKMGAKIHAHTFIPLPGTPFSKKTPGNIEPYIRKFINKVLPKGAVFGEFEKQKKLGKQLVDLRKTGRYKPI